MDKVFIGLGEMSYDIHIEKSLLNSISDYIGDADKWMIITDKNVDKLYGERVIRALEGKENYKFIIDPGEESNLFQQ